MNQYTVTYRLSCLLLLLLVTTTACKSAHQYPDVSHIEKQLILKPDPKLPPLSLSWDKNMLSIKGDHLPGGELQVWYIEAYCKPNSTDRDWNETVIGHTTKLIAADPDGKWLSLECKLKDGVLVKHLITVRGDGIDFEIIAHNPTYEFSNVHWAQPCIRVGNFTGYNHPARKYDYIANCFIFLDGNLHNMPTPNWATEARYTPGQVWCPRHVPRTDVNPRPLNPDVPSNGLIGAFSKDGKLLMATAFEPYQELFQGVIYCVHSDFRIGGLRPGELKEIKGRIYIKPNNIPALLDEYRRDFSTHH